MQRRPKENGNKLLPLCFKGYGYDIRNHTPGERAFINLDFNSIVIYSNIVKGNVWGYG